MYSFLHTFVHCTHRYRKILQITLLYLDYSAGYCHAHCIIIRLLYQIHIGRKWSQYLASTVFLILPMWQLWWDTYKKWSHNYVFYFLLNDTIFWMHRSAVIFVQQHNIKEVFCIIITVNMNCWESMNISSIGYLTYQNIVNVSIERGKVWEWLI